MVVTSAEVVVVESLPVVVVEFPPSGVSQGDLMMRSKRIFSRKLQMMVLLHLDQMGVR